jgi:hypothetical protein
MTALERSFMKKLTTKDVLDKAVKFLDTVRKLWGYHER